MWYGGRRRGSVLRSAKVALVATTALSVVTLQQAVADTMEGALALAYQNNPQLNAQRASVRATDEGVGVALSGYRPKVTATAQIGEQYVDLVGKTSSGAVGKSTATF